MDFKFIQVEVHFASYKKAVVRTRFVAS